MSALYAISETITADGEETVYDIPHKFNEVAGCEVRCIRSFSQTNCEVDYFVDRRNVRIGFDYPPASGLKFLVVLTGY